jgi:DNA polymerase (family 10)
VDAHSIQDLGYLRWSVGQARRGWVTRGDVLNSRSVDEFRKAVRPVA